MKWTHIYHSDHSDCLFILNFDNGTNANIEHETWEWWKCDDDDDEGGKNRRPRIEYSKEKGTIDVWIYDFVYSFFQFVYAINLMSNKTKQNEMEKGNWIRRTEKIKSTKNK